MTKQELVTVPKKKFKRMYKTSNYKRGRSFEYRTKNEYMKKGFWVVRSYASKGASDLYNLRVASSNALLNQDIWKCLQNVPKEYHKYIYEMLDHLTEVDLVQCKIGPNRITKKEIEGLKKINKITGGRPMHVWRETKRPYKMHYEKLPKWKDPEIQDIQK